MHTLKNKGALKVLHRSFLPFYNPKNLKLKQKGSSDVYGTIQTKKGCREVPLFLKVFIIFKKNHQALTF